MTHVPNNTPVDTDQSSTKQKAQFIDSLTD